MKRRVSSDQKSPNQIAGSVHRLIAWACLAVLGAASANFATVDWRDGVVKDLHGIVYLAISVVVTLGGLGLFMNALLRRAWGKNEYLMEDRNWEWRPTDDEKAQQQRHRHRYN